MLLEAFCEFVMLLEALCELWTPVKLLYHNESADNNEAAGMLLEAPCEFLMLLEALCESWASVSSCSAQVL